MVKIPGRTYLFHQGEKTSHLYIIKSGCALLSVLSSGGIEKILMFAGQGGIFGEQCIFDDMSQPYSAITIVECDLYKIPCNIFMSKVDKNRDFRKKFFHIVMRKQTMLVTQIADLSFGDACQRIAADLIYSAQIYGINTPAGIVIDILITQQDLGDKVQATRVTVNHIINKLASNGILSKKKRRYTIKDMDKLHKIKNDKRHFYDLPIK